MSKSLHKAFLLRQESDYKEFNIITREETEEIKAEAVDFINKIKTHLNLKD